MHLMIHDIVLRLKLHVSGKKLASSAVDNPYKRHRFKETAYFLYCSVESCPCTRSIKRKNVTSDALILTVTLFGCFAYIVGL